MLCHAAKEMFSAYLDAELSPEEARQVAEHLAACPACRQDFAELKAIVTALQNYEELPLPYGFTENIHALLAKEQKVSFWSKLATFKFYKVALIPACLVLLIAVGSVYGYQQLWSGAQDSALEQSTETAADMAADQDAVQDTASKEAPVESFAASAYNSVVSIEEGQVGAASDGQAPASVADAEASADIQAMTLCEPATNPASLDNYFYYTTKIKLKVADFADSEDSILTYAKELGAVTAVSRNSNLISINIKIATDFSAQILTKVESMGEVLEKNVEHETLEPDYETAQANLLVLNQDLAAFNQLAAEAALNDTQTQQYQAICQDIAKNQTTIQQIQTKLNYTSLIIEIIN